MNVEQLTETAQSWTDIDPDLDTQAAGAVLLAGGDTEVLRAHFGGHLRFGTAGMRGAMGPGPNRMNRAVVRRVTRGLSNYLCACVADAPTRGVVLGYDGRHKSRVFADEATAVLRAAGVPVYRFEGVTPTPRVAHALTHLGAAVGIVITASHNPPGDNGYKVYWGDGAQITPPHDRGIAEAIDWTDGAAPALPRAPQLPVPDAVHARYLERVLALRVRACVGARAVYTALHGVAGADMMALMSAAGHEQVFPVAAQMNPDGDFPTVAFPNPEETGALDLAIAQAKDSGADLVLANDPDGDRLGVAVRAADGTYLRLSGDQIGVLLAADLLENSPVAEDRMVATSIVSSTLLSRIAAAHGVAYRETLTGFKWIARAALEHDGRFIMGYEEALGYCVGDVVRDKDGLSAALLFLDLASDCKTAGETVLDRLLGVYRRYGFHGTRQRSVRATGDEGAARIQAAMDTLRANPPTTIGGHAVVRVRDVLSGQGRMMATGDTFTVKLPRSNVLEFLLEGGARVLARPSGTEPKIKFYSEVVCAVQPDDDLDTLARRADGPLDDLAQELLRHAGVDR
jgi:phosphomannomutase